MLNFNRFKYRSKAPLDFLSRRQDDAFPADSQKEVRNNNSRLLEASEVKNADDFKTSPTHITDLKNDSKECQQNIDRKHEGKVPGKVECDKYVSLSLKGRRASDENTVKKFKVYTDQREHPDSIIPSGSANPSGTLFDEGQILKEKVFTAEEKLRTMLSNGPKNCSSLAKDCLAGTQKDTKENDDEFKRKRKEPYKDTTQKRQNHSSFFDTVKVDSYKVEKKSPCSYESFVPKPKRKRVFLLEDSDEDIETNHKPRSMKTSSLQKEKGKYIAEECEENSRNIEKLREIYSHLSISEAKEALDLAGGLTDAILNLAKSLDIKEKDSFSKKERDSLSKEGADALQKSENNVLLKKEKAAKANSPKVIKLDEEDRSSSIKSEELNIASRDAPLEDETYDTTEETDESSCEMTKQELCVLSFFQDATLADIGTVPGLSDKKASLIIEQRPFEDYNDLIAKLSSHKGISEKVVDNVKDFINQQAMVDELMHECQKIATRITRAIKNVANFREDGDTTDIDFEDHAVISKQPAILNSSHQLKHYQLSGLNWLIALHKEGVNGILADQMGLGKTIQALAFIGYLIETGNSGPHVIIVPSSTFDNWVREIETWLPSVSYIQYKGSQDERRSLREEILYGEEEYNIIISTYNIAISTPKDRSLFRKLESHYVILDEGHMLKNVKSNRYKYLMDIRASRRLLLTGTPVQNNLLEMISLLSFLMPDLFADRLNGISMLFGAKAKYHGKIINTAKQILKPFILKRTKDTVLKDLPKKIEKLLYCEMTDHQKSMYKSLMAKCKRLAADDYSTAVAVFMQLRKVADHPLLERSLYNDENLRKMATDYIKQYENRESCFEYVLEDMEVMSDFELHNLCHEKYYLNKHCLPTEAILNSGKFKQLDELLPQLKSKGSRVLIFSQFTMLLDILETYLKHENHRYLRLDGQTPVSSRQSLIDEYNSNRDIFVFLLSTRAGGLGINLTSADTVIMHDIDFNPAIDKQAEDRCHRVGQTRDVTIYKLISKDTIEEAMLECANRKLKLGKVAENLEVDDSTSAEVIKYLMANIS